MCAKSNKHAEHVKPLYTTPFDALTFDILIQEMVFQEVDWVLSGLTHLKRCSPLSVPAPFCLFAISLLSKGCLFRSFALTKSLVPVSTSTDGKKKKKKRKKKHITVTFALKIFMAI